VTVTTSTSVASTTSTTLPGPRCSGDPTRTIFAGASERPCRRFDGDAASCAQAWAVTRQAEVVSCFYDGSHQTCEGCGPVNQSAGACSNECDGP
jgi:hypothetical protein